MSGKGTLPQASRLLEFMICQHRQRPAEMRTGTGRLLLPPPPLPPLPGPSLLSQILCLRMPLAPRTLS